MINFKAYEKVKIETKEGAVFYTVLTSITKDHLQGVAVLADDSEVSVIITCDDNRIYDIDNEEIYTISKINSIDSTHESMRSKLHLVK